MLYHQFIDAGHRLFGLHPIVDGKCGCRNKDCKAVGKHPFAASWQHTPLWSNDQILKMEEAGQFKTGYGVLVDGLLVIDVDARNGGVKSFKKLLKDIPSLADCGLVVNTGSGGGSQHLYYKVSSELALQGKHDDYEGIDFKSSGFVVGIGSQHKSGGSYEIASGSIDDIADAPVELVELLKKKHKKRVLLNDQHIDVSGSEVVEMLSCIDPDLEYDVWVKLGMAIHETMNGEGFRIWDEWSAAGSKYDASEMESKWFSFGKSPSPVGLGTLLYYAELAGYSRPVSFDSSEPSITDKQDLNGLPCDISNIDLLRPPEFVGEIAGFINSQCRYPRENLAVGAALSAVGNLIGLRYQDNYSNVTSNLFTFCVAASSTGKEAVLQAFGDIGRAAGINAASHGTIKSEQEITRNLLHHQAAIYALDEVGILLQKIENASRSGSASYLEGVIGLLMSAYSKANSYLLLSGDVRRDAETVLVKELTACIAKAETDTSGRYDKRASQIQQTLDNLSSGLERPFLSLLGFTTPETFSGLVTKSSITNGFIGRSLLITEKETNPRAKKRFKAEPMSDMLTHKIKMLYSAGTFSLDEDGGRVEFYGNKVSIPSTDDAMNLLDDIENWIHAYAETHKELSGLEAAIRRGFELVLKISFILGAPSGLRTAYHCQWAFAMVYKDINDKTMLAFANDNAKSKSSSESGRVLTAKILAQIDNKTGATISTLANRLRKPVKDIEAALEHLGSQVVMKSSTHKGNGQTVNKYYLK